MDRHTRIYDLGFLFDVHKKLGSPVCVVPSNREDQTAGQSTCPKKIFYMKCQSKLGPLFLNRPVYSSEILFNFHICIDIILKTHFCLSKNSKSHVAVVFEVVL